MPLQNSLPHMNMDTLDAGHQRHEEQNVLVRGDFDVVDPLSKSPLLAEGCSLAGASHVELEVPLKCASGTCGSMSNSCISTNGEMAYM
jgi:hypothetical protein